MQFYPVEVDQNEIEFKELNVDDFQSNGFDVVKSEIPVGLDGYITDYLEQFISERLIQKETVIINAGVGQGKTKRILNIIKKYFDHNYIVIVASPYLSLIDQYYNELIRAGISDTDITDFRRLKINETDHDGISYAEASTKSIHLVTINCLLGNPGDYYVEQSTVKKKYLKATVNFTRDQNKKVILVLDELHDGLDNFKERLILNLWSWEDVILKIFVLSATFNEASKVIIKYLGELTDNKLQILESRRIKVPEQRSDLYLCIYDKVLNTAEDSSFVGLFKYILDKIGNKKINVLSYSKGLCNSIVSKHGTLGNLLINKYGDGEINLCTAKTHLQYDAGKCNIGTNFSTGINIQSTDNVLVIILPPDNTSEEYKGIFTSGVFKVIQSIARMRGKGEIFIITSTPRFLIENPGTSNTNYRASINKIKTLRDIPFNSNKYEPLNHQAEILNVAHRRIQNEVRVPIQKVNDKRAQRTLENMPSLEFPCLEDFIFTEGELYLRTKYAIFGKDLSVYAFWAAFNDQFLNCSLKGIIIEEKLHLATGSILENLRRYIYSKLFTFIPDYQYNPLTNGMYSEELESSSDLRCYELIRTQIFNVEVYVDGKKISEYVSPIFERQILALVQIITKPNTISFAKAYSDELTLLDAEYSDRDYLLACFAQSIRSEEDYQNVTEDARALVIAYRAIATFFTEIFLLRFIWTDDNNKQYFETEITDTDYLSTREIAILRNAITFIKHNDIIIKKKVVSFFQDTLPDEPLQFTTLIYHTFKRKLFKYKEGRIRKNGIKFKRQVIIESCMIPEPTTVLNLLFN